MRLNAVTILSHPNDPEYEGMAHIYLTSDEGYVFSLSRFPDADAIEIMVSDQITARTSDVTAVLQGKVLVVRFPTKIARSLDGHAEYEIEMDFPSQQFDELHMALSSIFSSVGKYSRET